MCFSPEVQIALLLCMADRSNKNKVSIEPSIIDYQLLAIQGVQEISFLSFRDIIIGRFNFQIE